MASETYFSPGTAPLEKFARGVYDALPRNLEEANQMFNPIELLREAGGKSARFFESGGRDYQAGIEALIDTLMLGAGPASVGLASLYKTPLKKGTDFATDALQEAFNPMGASDDTVKKGSKVAVDTGTKGMTRRGFLGGTGAAMALAGAPILREAGDLLPTSRVIKATTPTFKELFTSAASNFKNITNIQKKIDNLKKSNKKSSDNPLEELFGILDAENTSEIKQLKAAKNQAAMAYDEFTKMFAEGLTKKDLMSLSDKQLIELNMMKAYSPVKNAGESIKPQFVKAPDGKIIDTNEQTVSLIDEVLKERGLFDPFAPIFDDFAEGGVVSLAPEARNMFNRPKGIESLIV